MHANIKNLRKHIIPIEKNLLSFKGEVLKKRTPLPISYWRYIKHICKKYDVELKIVPLKLRNGFYDLGSYDPIKRTIYLAEMSDRLGGTRNRRISIFLTIFFHELSHRIQHINNAYDFIFRDRDKKYRKETERNANKFIPVLWKKYIGEEIEICRGLLK